MAALRENVYNLCRKIDGTGRTITETDALYCCFCELLNDEQVDLCNFMDMRVPISAEELAERSGKSVEDTLRILREVREIGLVLDRVREEGTKWELLIVIPGMAENVILGKKQFSDHKEAIQRMFRDVSMMPPDLVPMLPVGVAGLAMHVIPIEEAIPAGTKVVPHDSISYWLDKYDYISVQDCQCRTMMASYGEWCGHTIKDRCFYFGDAARYIVETGRGRRVDKEEALRIMKEAEEEGCLHQCSNLDGEDEIFTICNCCRCGCNSIKNSQYYQMANANRSNFVAHVDPEKCIACGECVEYCPGNAVQLSQGLCMKTPLPEPEERVLLPGEWGPQYWNPGYRWTKDYVTESGTSPCKVECPAHISVQAYIRLAAQGKFREALELIKKENPFPAICGRICNHKCENECTRGTIDEAVSIDEIKKYIADKELNAADRYIPKKIHHYGDHTIAIIGAGPAGLSCAYYLALEGYQVTVFEKENVLGGMMTFGIPPFSLEKDIIDAEIDVIKQLGVEFKTGIEVGKDVTINELRSRGYEAFYIAIGAQNGLKVGIEGEEAEGVLTGIDFIRDVNLGKGSKLSGNVIVIGGGNVAIDAARVAVRENAETVEMYCLESPDEMTALPEEIEKANAERITVNNGWGPKRIIVENGKVKGVEFKRCISVFDEDHMFAPKYDENDTIVMPADYVLFSVGQGINWGKLLEGTSVEIGRGNRPIADPETYQTAEADIFVGGDVYTGPKFVIDAIAAGKQAATYIGHYVQPDMDMKTGIFKREFRMIDKENVVVEGYDNTPRQQVQLKTVEDKPYEDNRITFSEEQFLKETERCLKCGVSIVNENKCIGCGLCTTKCKVDAITISKVFDSNYVSAEDTPNYLEPNFVLKVKGDEVFREIN